MMQATCTYRSLYVFLHIFVRDSQTCVFFQQQAKGKAQKALVSPMVYYQPCYSPEEHILLQRHACEIEVCQATRKLGSERLLAGQRSYLSSGS